MNEIVPFENDTSLTVPKSKDIILNEQANEPTPIIKKDKKPKALIILSLVFAGISLPYAFLGLLPFQIFFLALSLVFHIIDRNKNGKRGVSVFSMICTILTFAVIFITLTYCIILFSFGMYTAFIDDVPYNFIVDTLKSVVAFVAGVFGFNINF